MPNFIVRLGARAAIGVQLMASPWPVVRAARQLMRPGKAKECTVCGFKGSFRPYRTSPDIRCPNCGSLERHRLLQLAMADGLFDPSRSLLHFAPEPFLSRRLAKDFSDYRTTDPSRPADLMLDIEAIDLPDASVEQILCSHVLEHVDDAKAISEMFRILTPGGRLVVMIPIIEGWRETYENDAVTTPEERSVHFGQHDHIRYYGADVRHRLKRPGFQLSEFVAGGSDSVRYGLRRGEAVFICDKPAAGEALPRQARRRARLSAGQ